MNVTALAIFTLVQVYSDGFVYPVVQDVDLAYCRSARAWIQRSNPDAKFVCLEAIRIPTHRVVE